MSDVWTALVESFFLISVSSSFIFKVWQENLVVKFLQITCTFGWIGCVSVAISIKSGLSVGTINSVET